MRGRVPQPPSSSGKNTRASDAPQRRRYQVQLKLPLPRPAVSSPLQPLGPSSPWPRRCWPLRTIVTPELASLINCTEAAFVQPFASLRNPRLRHWTALGSACLGFSRNTRTPVPTPRPDYARALNRTRPARTDASSTSKSNNKTLPAPMLHAARPEHHPPCSIGAT